RGVVLVAPGYAQRQVLQHIRLDVHVSGIADLPGVDAGADAAVAVGGGRLARGDLLSAAVQSRRTHVRGAVVEQLGSVGTGRVRGRITQELLVDFVAPFEPSRDVERARQSGNRPRVAHVDVEVRFLLHELAVVEVLRRHGAQ